MQKETHVSDQPLKERKEFTVNYTLSFRFYSEDTGSRLSEEPGWKIFMQKLASRHCCLLQRYGLCLFEVQ